MPTAGAPFRRRADEAPAGAAGARALVCGGRGPLAAERGASPGTRAAPCGRARVPGAREGSRLQLRAACRRGDTILFEFRFARHYVYLDRSNLNKARYWSSCPGRCDLFAQYYESRVETPLSGKMRIGLGRTPEIPDSYFVDWAYSLSFWGRMLESTSFSTMIWHFLA